MSGSYVLLALLMGAVTYPSRAVPLLLPGLERLRPRALLYLRLVGPATLAALVATSTMLVSGSGGKPTLHASVTWVAVAAAIAIVAWRRNVVLGVIVAVALTALARALGLA
jgi:branched-subunit amino acid transport protein